MELVRKTQEHCLRINPVHAKAMIDAATVDQLFSMSKLVLAFRVTPPLCVRQHDMGGSDKINVGIRWYMLTINVGGVEVV